MSRCFRRERITSSAQTSTSRLPGCGPSRSPPATASSTRSSSRCRSRCLTEPTLHIDSHCVRIGACRNLLATSPSSIRVRVAASITATIMGWARVRRRAPPWAADRRLCRDRHVLRGAGDRRVRHQLARAAVRCRAHAHRRDRHRHGIGSHRPRHPIRAARLLGDVEAHVRSLPARDPRGLRQFAAAVRRGVVGGRRGASTTRERTGGARRTDARRCRARTAERIWWRSCCSARGRRSR